MNFNEEVGKRIKYYRKKAGITQAELELRSGIGAGMLSRYETGKSALTVEQLYRIAEALSINPALLILPERFTEPPEEQNAEGIFDSVPNFMYYYDGRTNKVMESYLEFVCDGTGPKQVLLYHGISGGDKNKVQQIYMGHLECRGKSVFMVFDNPNVSVEKVFISFFRPELKDSSAIGIVSAISTVHQLTPMALLAIFSHQRMAERDVIDAIKFDAKAMSHIKANNMLMPYKTIL